MALRTMLVKMAKNQMNCAMWQTTHFWHFAAFENGLRLHVAYRRTTVIFQQYWMNLSCIALPITYLGKPSIISARNKERL